MLQPRCVLLQLPDALVGVQLPRRPKRRTRLLVLLFRQMTQDVPYLVVSTTLHQVRRPEHPPDGLPQRLGAVDDEQTPPVSPQAPRRSSSRPAVRVLRCPAAKPQHVLTTIRIHTDRRHHVVVPEHDPVEVTSNAQVPFGQLLQNARPRLDGLPRDLRRSPPPSASAGSTFSYLRSTRPAAPAPASGRPVADPPATPTPNLHLARLIGPRPLAAAACRPATAAPSMPHVPPAPRASTDPGRRRAVPAPSAPPPARRSQDGSTRPAHHVDHLADQRVSCPSFASQVPGGSADAPAKRVRWPD